MQRVHARYPFLSGAREAVEGADVDLAALVREGGAPVERAERRVAAAISEGTVGEASRSNRVELLSYPVARVLVSLVDERALTRKYGLAEARTAHDRFTTDLESGIELRSTGGDGVTVDRLLAEFDLAGDVRESGEEFRVHVGAYLRLASGIPGEEWRLVNRPLSDGEVPVDRRELYELLREAVRTRVEDGLPLSVPDAVADPLDPAVERLRESLSDLDLSREIDTVVPELFPPCMTALLDRIRKGEHLEHHSRFAITAFLASIGMSTDEIVELYRVNPGFGEEQTRYQTNHIRGETGPTEYSPPSCRTMQSYGDCVNMDDRCETISHPLAYYEAALDDVDEEEYEDWRADAEG